MQMMYYNIERGREREGGGVQTIKNIMI